MITDDMYVERIPEHLDNTFIRPPGITAPDLIKFDFIPTNSESEYNSKNNQIHFTLNTSSNLLDPYALFFEFDIINNNDNPIQLDGSAHSLISSITVLSNGQVIEKITDYDFIQSIYFDMNLTREQRSKRKEHEGFGDNFYGTNETIINSKKHYFNKTIHNANHLVNEKLNNIFDPHNLSVNLVSPDSDNVKVSYLNSKDYLEYGSKVLSPDTDIVKYHDWNIPFVNKWQYVLNGKLSPMPNKISDLDSMRNVKKFRLPLMLKTIGFGQQTNNYKLVPLEFFGILTIVITMNPDAFIVPSKQTAASYFGVTDYIDADKNLKKHQSVEFENPTVDKFIIKNCKITTEQYRFSTSIHNQLINQVKTGGWVLDYMDMEIIDQIYTKDFPKISYTKAISRKNIRAIYIAFTNDLYKKNKYARKLSRLNKGVTNIFFKQAGAQYPPNTNVVHNSLYSHGKENGQFFYNELAKCMGKIDNKVPFINLTNFCINYDSSHVRAMINTKSKNDTGFTEKLVTMENSWAFTDKEWTKYVNEDNKARMINDMSSHDTYAFLKRGFDKMSGYLEDVSSKTLYALNFETVPHSYGLYKTGINTAFNIPFIIEIERDADNLQLETTTFTGTYTFCWFIFEYFVTIQLTPEGQFIRQ